jgi:hypothetical protein
MRVFQRACELAKWDRNISAVADASASASE